ncbi:hypothetical protein KT71_002887 [Congregibacter litoralis KT71]|uniref:Uncharacterized protein n=1 Tax=Congregibacter litoralis KT71 TaxID=314285 RepID=V7HRZ6_9GAMM|nr:hypothetical protein KT71_002887 [Congregibacter litoralis KT71]
MNHLEAVALCNTWCAQAAKTPDTPLIEDRANHQRLNLKTGGEALRLLERSITGEPTADIEPQDETGLNDRTCNA